MKTSGHRSSFLPDLELLFIRIVMECSPHCRGARMRLQNECSCAKFAHKSPFSRQACAHRKRQKARRARKIRTSSPAATRLHLRHRDGNDLKDPQPSPARPRKLARCRIHPTTNVFSVRGPSHTPLGDVRPWKNRKLCRAVRAGFCVFRISDVNRNSSPRLWKTSGAPEGMLSRGAGFRCKWVSPAFVCPSR